MKIGFFTPHPFSFNGGIERVSSGIVQALEKRGHEVEMNTVHELKYSPVSRLVKHAMRWTPYSSLQSSWKLAHAVKHTKYDAIISNDFYGMFARAPKKICLMHGYFGDVFDSIQHKISPLYYLWGRELARLQRMAVARADVSVVPCDHSKNSFAKDGAHINRVIPHGIDTQLFSPRKIKKSLSVPGHYLVHVASAAPWKNFEMIEKLSEKHPIVCVSKPRNNVFGNIQFMNGLSNEDLAGLYSRADAMVHPAFHEGFGFVACEAMACETPAVITNTGYGPDIAKVFPELVVQNPRDENEFNEKIAFAVANRKKIGKKCRSFIQKNNDYKKWQKKWVDLVEE